MDPDGILITKSGNGINDVVSQTCSLYWVSLRVYADASNLVDGWPVIFINGTVQLGRIPESEGFIRIYPCYISFEPTYLNPVIAWLMRLWNSLSDWFDDLVSVMEDMLSSLTPDANKGDGYSESVDQQTQEITDSMDIINSMEFPDLVDSDIDTSTIIATSDVILATAPLTALMNNGIIKQVFILAMMFVLAAYVFYGKR